MQYLLTHLRSTADCPHGDLRDTLKKLNSLCMKCRFFWVMAQLVFNSYSAEDVLHLPFPVAQVPLLSVKIQPTEN